MEGSGSMIDTKSLRSQIENGQHACGGERVMLPTETVVSLLDDIDRLEGHIHILSSACEEARIENENIKRTPAIVGATLSGCVHCSLLEVREKQATSMCTWLTAENQRLRDALEIAEHLDGEWDELLEQSEEDVVENAQLQNKLAAMTAARNELVDIALTYVTAYLHTEPGKKDRDAIAALRKVGQ
jgi:hypothetical protein